MVGRYVYEGTTFKVGRWVSLFKSLFWGLTPSRHWHSSKCTDESGTGWTAFLTSTSTSFSSYSHSALSTLTCSLSVKILSKVNQKNCSTSTSFDIPRGKSKAAHQHSLSDLGTCLAPRFHEVGTFVTVL